MSRPVNRAVAVTFFLLMVAVFVVDEARAEEYHDEDCLDKAQIYLDKLPGSRKAASVRTHYATAASAYMDAYDHGLSCEPVKDSYTSNGEAARQTPGYEGAAVVAAIGTAFMLLKRKS